MAQPINRFKLGLFVLAALALCLLTVIALSLGDYFSPAIECETYFDTSIQGLDRGAQVRLRGIKIGQVTQVSLSSASYKNSGQLILVKFTVDPYMFSEKGSEGKASKQIEAQIEEGLRVKLSSMGITGVSFLELDYIPKDSPRLPIIPDWNPKDIYIPSMPGIITEVSQSLTKITQSLEALDFDKISESVIKLSNNLDKSFSGLDILLSESTEMVKELRVTVGNADSFVKVLDGQTIMLSDEYSNLSQEATATLKRLNLFLKMTEQSLAAPKGELGVILKNLSLISEDLSEAARMLKDNPSFMLMGSKPPKDEHKKSNKKIGSE